MGSHVGYTKPRAQNPLGLEIHIQIPEAAVFNGVAKRATGLEFGDIQTADFQQDYIVWRLQTGRDIEEYLKIVNSRLSLRLDPFSGVSRVCWAESTCRIEDDDGGHEVDLLDTVASEDNPSLQEIVLRKWDEKRAEKREAFEKKISVPAIQRKTGVGLERAREINRAIRRKIREDFENGVPFVAENYIPKKREKGKGGRKKKIHQADMFDGLDNRSGLFDGMEGGAA